MKHAVIYVPGSTQHLLPQSLSVVAERLAVALSQARSDLQDVRITYTPRALGLGAVDADLARLEGLSDAGWQELADLYEVNYLETFVKRFTARSSFERAVSAVYIFIVNLGVIGQIFTGRTKRFLDRMQGVFLGVLILFLAAYLVYWSALAITAASTAVSLAGATEAAATKVSVPADGAAAAEARTWALGGALLVAGMTLLRFAARSVVTSLERSAIEFYALCEYIRDDTPFQACHALIRDAVVALRREGYERVDLLCYSLGCIVAGDAILPRRPGLRATPDHVDGWATIGYPYDLVKAAYPAYFAGRAAPALAVTHWWNVTEGQDFLGSNFREDNDAKDPDPKSGIFPAGGGEGRRPDRNLFFAPPQERAPVERSWVDAVLPLRRITNHGLYWDPRNPRGESCFTHLVASGFCNPDAASPGAKDAGRGQPAKRARRTSQARTGRTDARPASVKGMSAPGV